MIRFRVIIALMCIVGSSCSCEAQLWRKAGNFLWKKAGKEVAGETAEKAGKTVIARSSKSAVRHAGTSAAGKATTYSSKTVARAGSLTKHYGDDAIKLANRASVSAKDLRRMSMLADDIPASQRKQLMQVVANHETPSKVISWLYAHKGELVTGGLLVAFLAQPEEVMAAASEGVATIIDATGKSLIAPVAREAARPVGHWLGFTCFGVSMLAMCGWLMRAIRAKPKLIGQTD